MNTPPFGAAIVGTGIMGRRMLAALQAHPRWQVVTLWDPDPAALQAARELAPAARGAAGLADAVADPAVTLVYVASPPAAHRAAVVAALQAGRACLCEKPLAHDAAEAQALRDAVAAAGQPFAVNFPFASGAARQLADAVQAGQLGRIHTARVTLRFAQWPRPWQAGAAAWLAGPDEGGFTREVLSHFVFLAQRLFGPARVAEVALQRAPGRAESALQARLQHGGLALDIDAAVAGSVSDHNRFELFGDRGQAVLADWGRLSLHDAQGRAITPPAAGPGSLDRLAQLVDRPGGADPGLATADEALAVVRVVEALLAPAGHGTSPQGTP